MRSLARYTLVVVIGLSFGACRQADGPVPVPDENVQEELVDVSRDLQNIAAGDPQAPADLASDLGKYAEGSDAAPAVAELSRQTADALAGVELPEQTAQRLAHNLWVAVAARELSERQVEGLQNDVRLLLTSLGVTEQEAQQIAAQAGTVQGAVGERPRRWYELF